jgi:diaminopimelate epimerase
MSIPDLEGHERLHFIKYHGLGNDFAVFVGGTSGLASPSRESVIALCHRGKGIGADGIVLARPSSVAPIRMELINSDGSVPEMCGNGLRCFVKYAVEELGLDANPLNVETVGGVRRCFATIGEDGTVTAVRVEMGQPTFQRSAIPVAGSGTEALGIQVQSLDRRFEATGVNTGNPHMVIFDVADVGRAFVERYGPPLEVHPLWPEKANVEFVTVESPERLTVVVWERGCGLTQACGTGATASVAAACKLGRAPFDKPVAVRLLGGELKITIEGGYRASWMEGPAVEAYRATLSRAWWR